MTKTKINQAIAKELKRRGIFLTLYFSRGGYIHYSTKDTVGGCLDMFTSSLDNCRMFEETLSATEIGTYCEAMEIVMGGEHLDDFLLATAPQRCEAFLRAMGKWKS